MEQHSIIKREADAKLKRIFISNGGDSRTGARIPGAHQPIIHCLKTGSGKPALDACKSAMFE